MANYEYAVKNKFPDEISGIAGENIPVTVYKAGTNRAEKAELFDIKTGDPISNPILAGENGYISFDTAPGEYELVAYDNVDGKEQVLFRELRLTDATSIAQFENRLSDLEAEEKNNADYLTLAEAIAADLEVGKYVRITDRGGLWRVTTGTPNSFDVIDIGNQLSLAYQVEKGVVELDHVGCLEADVTSAANAMIAKYPVTRFSSRTYNTDYIEIPDNKTVLTLGFSTILQQNSGVTGDVRLVNIKGSNVSFALDGVCVKGNIASDTGEQKHAIFINKPDGAIKNINVGDVFGEDVRGDAVYIGSFFDNGGESSIDNVNVGNVYAKNVYRNGVSVTNGAKNVTIGDIVEDKTYGCSVCAIDIEPDSNGRFCENITFGDVHGRRVGVVGQFGTNKVRGVTTGHLDLDESRPASTPEYDLSGNDFDGRCFFIRNADVTIASGKIENSKKQAIYTSKLTGDNLSSLVCNGKLEVTSCNQDRATTGVLELVLLAGLGSFTCSELVLSSDSPATEFCLSGTSGSGVKVNIGKFTSNCHAGRFFGGIIKNIDVTYTEDRYSLQNIDSSLLVQGGKISAGRITGFNTALVHFSGVELIYTSLKYSNSGNGGFHTIEDGCTDNGTFNGRLVDNA